MSLSLQYVVFTINLNPCLFMNIKIRYSCLVVDVQRPRGLVLYNSSDAGMYKGRGDREAKQVNVQVTV